jgi:hypothetical protein
LVVWLISFLSGAFAYAYQASPHRCDEELPVRLELAKALLDLRQELLGERPIAELGA